MTDSTRAWIATGVLVVVATSVSGECPRPDGDWRWGRTRAVAADARAAWTPWDPGLRAADVDPVLGGLRGSLGLEEPVTDLAAADGLLAVAAADGRLLVVDGSDPAAPVVLADVVRPAGDARLALDRPLLALAVGSAVALWDVSDPASPAAGATIDAGFEITAVAVADGTVVAAGDDWMAAWDAGDPARPLSLGARTVPGPTPELAIDGRWVYAAGRGLLRVHDLGSSPVLAELEVAAHPSVVSERLAPLEEEIAVARALEGDDGWRTSVYLFERSDPPDLGTWESHALARVGVLAGLEGTGEHLVMAWRDGHLSTWDLGYPGPGRSGIDRDPPPWPVTGVGWSGDLTVAVAAVDTPSVPGGGRLTVLGPSGAGGGLEDLGWVTLPGVGRHTVADGGVLTVRWEVRAADGWDDSGLSVVDLSDPARPVEAARFAGWTGAGGLAAYERWLVAGDMERPTAGDGELIVLDRTDPLAPVEAARLPVDGIPRSVALAGDRLLVAAQEGQLQVVDPAALPQLELTARVTVGPAAWDVAADAGVALVVSRPPSASPDELVVVSLAAPDAPAVTGRLASAETGLGSIDAVAVSGPRGAAIGFGTGGHPELVVLDLSEPAAVRVAGRGRITDGTTGPARGIAGLAIEGDTVLAGWGSAGLQRWRLDGCVPIGSTGRADATPSAE